MPTDMSAVTAHRHAGRLVHREGKVPLQIASLAALIAVLGARGRARGPVGLLAALSLGFLAQFFRHPGANTTTAAGAVVAPASGHIVHIGPEYETEILSEERLRISIFLSLFDAHLTRSPISGRITYQRYHSGRYLVALHPKASELNERNSVLIEYVDGTRILVREIAGLIARRICTYVQPGAFIVAGEEIGYIKLGSRVDVFLPRDATIAVTQGQRVRAGETLLAHLQPRGA